MLRQLSVLVSLLAITAACAIPAAAQSRRGSPAERGKYLVTVVGCNDCHSPKVFTPRGPAVDSTRMLSGHPASNPAPAVPEGAIGMTPAKWAVLTTGDLTAWRGPWGTSFTANLTPDKETGLGSWTEEMFIAAVRTGKHMGKGRDILPPMPVDAIGKMSDQDLKAVFAYLRTLPPVSNAVPDPIPPPEAGKK